jgi:hypothetical protein
MHSVQPIVAVSKEVGPVLVLATTKIDCQFSNRFRGEV